MSAFIVARLILGSNRRKIGIKERLWLGVIFLKYLIITYVIIAKKLLYRSKKSVMELLAEQKRSEIKIIGNIYDRGVRWII